MSEQSKAPEAWNTIPGDEEPKGSYSTWRQKGDFTKNSNRHTYLIDEDGKRRVISRAAFKDRFEPSQAIDEAASVESPASVNIESARQNAVEDIVQVSAAPLEDAPADIAPTTEHGSQEVELTTIRADLQAVLTGPEDDRDVVHYSKASNEQPAHREVLRAWMESQDWEADSDVSVEKSPEDSWPKARDPLPPRGAAYEKTWPLGDREDIQPEEAIVAGGAAEESGELAVDGPIVPLVLTKKPTLRGRLSSMFSRLRRSEKKDGRLPAAARVGINTVAAAAAILSSAGNGGEEISHRGMEHASATAQAQVTREAYTAVPDADPAYRVAMAAVASAAEASEATQANLTGVAIETATPISLADSAPAEEAPRQVVEEAEASTVFTEAGHDAAWVVSDSVHRADEIAGMPFFEPQSPPPTAEQAPAPEVQPEEVADEPVSGEVEQGASEHQTDSASEAQSDNVIESVVNTPEVLMVGVEVEPGDGVTQVLAKVLAQAGYADVSPDKLFEFYEEMVTDPSIGPDAIFEGITLEYNPVAGQYWIQGEGGVQTHLTPAAAEWIQSAIGD